MGCKRIHKYTEYRDLKDMLKKSGEKYADRPAYVFKTDKKDEFRYITHKEVRLDVDALGTKLIAISNTKYNKSRNDYTKSIYKSWF